MVRLHAGLGAGHDAPQPRVAVVVVLGRVLVVLAARAVLGVRVAPAQQVVRLAAAVQQVRERAARGRLDEEHAPDRGARLAREQAEDRLRAGRAARVERRDGRVARRALAARRPDRRLGVGLGLRGRLGSGGGALWLWRVLRRVRAAPAHRQYRRLLVRLLLQRRRRRRHRHPRAADGREADQRPHGDAGRRRVVRRVARSRAERGRLRLGQALRRRAGARERAHGRVHVLRALRLGEHRGQRRGRVRQRAGVQARAHTCAAGHSGVRLPVGGVRPRGRRG